MTADNAETRLTLALIRALNPRDANENDTYLLVTYAHAARPIAEALIEAVRESVSEAAGRMGVTPNSVIRAAHAAYMEEEQ